MNCGQVGTVISCILFCSDIICFTSLCLHQILPISGFGFFILWALLLFLHSCFAHLRLHSFFTPYFLPWFFPPYMSPFLLIYYFLTSFISSWLPFLICPYNSSLFLPFIPHFLSSTIITAQSAFILCFQEPHIWTSTRKLKIRTFLVRFVSSTLKMLEYVIFQSLLSFLSHQTGCPVSLPIPWNLKLPAARYHFI